MVRFRRIAGLVAVLVLGTAGPAMAQEQESPSVTVLPAPGPVSSGEALPAAGEGIPVEAPPPPPCGTEDIAIASMQWPSAQILAEIHAKILTEAFGCTVRIVPGDMAATGSSMGTTGQPAVAPELWIARIAEIWNQATKAQKVRQAGVTYADPALEGWFVPDYVAAAHPELKTAAALKDVAATLLPSAAGPPGAAGAAKPQFISCPVDWACSVINRNLLRALGLDGLFDVVEPGNRFEMDTRIAEAVGRKEPVVFYYWQPNAVLAQFSFQSLDLGPYDHDAFQCLGRRLCDAPKPSAFAPEPVVTALADWVFTDAPEIAAYFARARMPLAEMDRLLAMLSETGATPATVAARFVAEREEVWRPWVGEPVAVPPAQ
jgi:glycine betaine/proline transport system substrate-binding protein